MEEEVIEIKRYTVFSFTSATRAIEALAEGEEYPSYMAIPNKPRLSLDKKRGIVTGVFGEAPYAVHLSQVEAEELMNSKEWARQSVN